jgi:hypothetical protein
MSGRALIFIVAGVIIISGIILYRIEAASTSLVANSVGYFKRQSARDIAQSGVNMALRHLGNDSSWRAASWSISMASGTAKVRVFDTSSYLGISPAIGIRATATVLDTVQMSSAFCYFPIAIVPTFIKGLLTLNSTNSTINGNITIDGRDHDTSGNIIAGSGVPGIWTTGSSFNVSGSAAVGGTSGGTDYAPPGGKGVANPSVVLLNQVVPSPGYPTSPDSVFGGASKGYPEGTLKAIAQSGLAGSQYTTDPSKLKYPLRGVTYVELDKNSNVWNPADITGSGILIVHNSTKNAVMKDASGTFKGIVINDDVVNFHGTIYGGLVGITPFAAGNSIGNGNANMNYSRQAITLATSIFTAGAQPKVIAWWE